VLDGTLTKDPGNKAAQLEIERSIAQVVPGRR
jgi:hypothetical protein